jgi:hypothetical protein
MTVRIDVETAIEQIKSYRELNKPDLEDLEFMIEGEPVTIPQEVLKRFSYLGLNNTDFIRWFFMKEEFFNTMSFTNKT